MNAVEVRYATNGTGTRRIALVDRLLRVTAQDLLIAIDVRRYARGTVLVAKRFRDIGADVAVLEDSPLSPLSDLPTFKLPVTMTGASAFDSCTAAISLVNAVVTGVADLRQQEPHETLEWGKALWQAFWPLCGRCASRRSAAPPKPHQPWGLPLD